MFRKFVAVVVAEDGTGRELILWLSVGVSCSRQVVDVLSVRFRFV